MSEAPLLFLDANALASPVTRTLLIAGARADGLRWTWSRHVEVEADRHARGQALRTSIVRKTILGTELSPTAQGMEGLVTDSPQDRQVVADAIRAGARYLITTDVDDFAFDDLAAHGMSAVSPDYFMALRFTEKASICSQPCRRTRCVRRPRFTGCSAAGIPAWSHSSLVPTTRHRSRPTQTSRSRSSEALPASAARRILTARWVYNTDCARSIWVFDWASPEPEPRSPVVRQRVCAIPGLPKPRRAKPRPEKGWSLWSKV